MPEFPSPIDGPELSELYTTQMSLLRQVGTDTEPGLPINITSIDKMVSNRVGQFEGIISECNRLGEHFKESLKFKNTVFEKDLLGHNEFDLLQKDFSSFRHDILEFQGIGQKYNDEVYSYRRDPGGKFGEMFSRFVGLGIIEELPTFSISIDNLNVDYVDYSSPEKVIFRYFFRVIDDETSKIVTKMCELSIKRYPDNDSLNHAYQAFQIEVEKQHQKHIADLKDFHKKHGKIDKKLIDGKDAFEKKRFLYTSVKVK